MESCDQSHPVCGDRWANQHFHLSDAYLNVDHVSPVLLPSADTVGFAVPRRSGGYVAGVGRNIVAVDWQTHKVTSLVEVDEDKPNNRLNDGKADPSGRLLTGQSAHLVTVLPACLSVAMVTVGCVLGTMLKDYPSGERKQGALFSVAPDLTVTKHLSQVT